MNALLFDAGNTRLKWGVLREGRLARTGSISHERLRDAGFGALTAKLPRAVDTALACNVAGQRFATRLSAVIGIHCGRELHFARTRKKGWGLVNAYRQPRQMGVDRWVAMIGAYSERRGAVCVVDAGTAVTVDAVDREGRHLGGMILPGLALMAASLHGNTSDIPAVERRGTAGATGMALFGDTTARGVRNGALAAVCGAVDRAMATLRRGGHRPKLLLTGGDAARILEPLSAGRPLHRPHLVLQGLAHMVQGQE